MDTIQDLFSTKGRNNIQESPNNTTKKELTTEEIQAKVTTLVDQVVMKLQRKYSSYDCYMIFLLSYCNYWSNENTPHKNKVNGLIKSMKEKHELHYFILRVNDFDLFLDEEDKNFIKEVEPKFIIQYCLNYKLHKHQVTSSDFERNTLCLDVLEVCVDQLGLHKGENVYMPYSTIPSACLYDCNNQYVYTTESEWSDERLAERFGAIGVIFMSVLGIENKCCSFKKNGELNTYTFEEKGLWGKINNVFNSGTDTINDEANKIKEARYPGIILILPSIYGETTPKKNSQIITECFEKKLDSQGRMVAIAPNEWFNDKEEGYKDLKEKIVQKGYLRKIASLPSSVSKGQQLVYLFFDKGAPADIIEKYDCSNCDTATGLDIKEFIKNITKQSDDSVDCKKCDSLRPPRINLPSVDTLLEYKDPISLQDGDSFIDFIDSYNLSKKFEGRTISQNILTHRLPKHTPHYKLEKGCYIITRMNKDDYRIGYIPEDLEVDCHFEGREFVCFSIKESPISDKQIIEKILFELKEGSSNKNLKERIKEISIPDNTQDEGWDGKIDDTSETTISIIRDKTEKYKEYVRSDNHMLGHLVSNLDQWFKHVSDKLEEDTRKDFETYLDQTRYITEHLQTVTEFNPVDIQLKEFIDKFVDKDIDNSYTKIWLKEDIIPENTIVTFDEKALTRIIDNICLNAEEHGFKEQDRTDYKIGFSITHTNEGVILSVYNNGTPLDIAPEEAFKKDKSTGDPKKNSGWGCYDIRRLMDGPGLEQCFGTVDIKNIDENEGLEDFKVEYKLTFLQYK